MLPVICTLLLAADPPSFDRAVKEAVARAAPGVVVIETSGGTERVGRVRVGTGPATGLVATADGYVFASAFRFAYKPTAITVSVAGRSERYPARLVATDHLRGVALLKIEADNLPVPTAVPVAEVRVGQTAIALGRAIDPNPNRSPSVAVGIVSATGRIWGKAIQTDAKTSPVNYGGPLIDLDGNVLGLIVPASPRGDGEEAGFEWYDSGIGFAMPLADLFAVLPKLRDGRDLRKGLLGITPKGPDQFGDELVVGTVTPESAGAKAGLKTGDVITAVDGKPVANQAQFMHAMGTRYEGDRVSLTVRRGRQTLELADVALMGAVVARQPGFAGFVPVRDDPAAGVAVRFVFPDSPVANAGLQPGDRITAVGLVGGEVEPFSGRDELRDRLDPLLPGTELEFRVTRASGGKTETLKLTLVPVPDLVPAELPEPASLCQALAPRQPADAGGLRLPQFKPAEEPRPRDDLPPAETGLLRRTSPSGDRRYWLYVPPNYDPNVAHAAVVWLHEAGRGGKDAEDLVDIWREACGERRLILVGPESFNRTGWLASESETVQEIYRELLGQYTLDRARAVVHGRADGGQMAYYLGLNQREWVRGVATTGAELTVPLKDNVPGLRVNFFLVAGADDPALKKIAPAKSALREHQFPVIYREPANLGRDYLDRETFAELVRWIDSLDRI